VSKIPEKIEILFEVKDVIGRNIRTTKNYWQKITGFKHPELKFGVKEVKSTLSGPDETRVSVTDASILLYSKRIEKGDILIIAVKVLNGEGFIVTVYQTKIYKKKGRLIWQKNKRR